MPKFRNKNDVFSGATFQLGLFLINCLFLLRSILEEQGGVDGRKGTGNCILMRSETYHRIRAITLLNISILLEQFLLEYYAALGSACVCVNVPYKITFYSVKRAVSQA